MKKYIIILFIIISCSLSNAIAQEYTPFSFNNFETEWTHHAYDEDLLDKKINEYMLEDVVVRDDAIYVVYSIPSVLWHFNGFLLEKLDTETGTLLWDYTYFQESECKRDMPSRISIKDDNTLILSTFRELEEEEEPSFWYLSQMNNWVFDTDTGELLDTLTTINGDPNHVPMVMRFNPVLLHYVQSAVNEKDDAYQYLLSTEYYGNIRILDYTLNELGHPIHTDSILLPLKYERINRSYTERLGENLIFNFRKSYDENNPQDSFNIEITHLDSNLNILHTKNISNDFFGEEHYLYQVNESNFSVVHFGDYVADDQPVRRKWLYTYDLEGNLLEEIPLIREDGTHLYSAWGFNVFPIKELNRTLLIFFNETDAFWEWFLTTPDGDIEQIGKTVLNNINDIFAWRSFNTPYMKYLGDGKLLLYVIHLPEEGSNNEADVHIPSLSVISLDKLQTTVSVENIKTNNNVTVYPNPTSSIIRIKDTPNKSYNRYEIIDVMGVTVQSGDIHSNTVRIDKFSNGVYTLKLYDSKNNIHTQKVVKQ